MIKKDNSPIYVTQPDMPVFDEFVESLREIWDSKFLTNNGKFHQELEKRIAEYLKVPYVSLFSNGTLALITALQTLRIQGEVITTPFSFVATTHSLHWNGIKPVFVDIEEEYLNLDPEKIEAAITPQTTAILPVHVYGRPCNHEKIQEIADNYGLKVIYDAAHAFDVNHNGSTILDYGDLNVLSFHATKTFNTIEGGAIISHDIKTKQRIDFLKNFGFANETTIVAPGINAKMNEVQAAYGLLQFKSLENNRLKRQKVWEKYSEELKDVPGVKIPELPDGLSHNYSYYPALIEEQDYGISRDKLYDKLKEERILTRRYFYPLISNIPTYRGHNSSKLSNLPIANKIAEQVLCLPLYASLESFEVEKIISLVKNNVRENFLI
ncbi:dTDP-4-amino-4,6-dideoxygalactose transaminase [Gramella sp. Hel_I_59]|uniref:DegT/DnrJ/EryC1/StrS family aminotransferase n=1 Tax=Gramella sp. Hel_I_59 TaxID=1249978 RepID=UPI0011501A76|nr:DegT/DnrJ/EryC1/StrS family aminotransferase [Gramella sp. Hel_I_59]TQI71952.1 dTDP-4-amino-4,6-dideoxygalactose transaminase [Gramella sp. Hel_I_59]